MPLKLSRRFIFSTSLLVLSIVSLTVLALFSDTGLKGSVEAIGGLACAAAVFGLLWSAHKYQGTQLSEAGVEQVTMLGKIFLPWNEVMAVRMYSKAFMLDSMRGTVVVYPKAYERPDEVAEFVVIQMRKVMEERGARVQPNDTKMY